MKIIAIWAVFLISVGAAFADVSVMVGYLKIEQDRPPTLSNLDPVPDDAGIAGATLGLADNSTTGRFLGHEYEMVSELVPLGDDPKEAAAALLRQTPFLIVDGPAAIIRDIADLPDARDAIIFNVAAPNISLRQKDCRANVLHTLPSYAMRADALSQFLVKRRWDDVVLIEGVHDGDRAFATAIRQSLKKFGLRLRSEKTWAFDADMRRNASQEVPLFTQGLRSHDILLIADELHDFGRYIAYNTWDPRPVAGSEGLTATAWAPVVEQWGAAQLQSRFSKSAGREMGPVDYSAWAAMRTIGEATTRTNSDDAQQLRSFILGPEFELAGFKGRPLSYRPWNGQLRQPIPLTHPRALVAMAPLEGFLHPNSELDTLGLDAPESECAAFQ